MTPKNMRFVAVAIEAAASVEELLSVNRYMEGPFIPPTAIDWLGDGIVQAITDADCEANI